MADHKYGTLPTHDDLDHNNHHRTSSSFDEEEAAREAEWEREQKLQERKLRRRWIYSWIIDICLIVVILGLLAERAWLHFEGRRFEVGSDVTGFAPRFSKQITRFKPDERFVPEDPAEFWGNGTQEAWLGLVPRALGYVVVKEPGKYSGLPHPVHDYPNQTVFTTSMTHQLHCLYIILEAYSALNSQDYREFSPKWHINHCFDYLRQSIMCAGDVALEGAETTFPREPGKKEGNGGSDGWDARHVCKNYGEVFEYLESYRANDDRWI